MKEEVISLDKYNDVIQIDTLHPIKKSSFINRSRQTIRMNYAAELNKLDILQRVDFKNFVVSKMQEYISVLLLAYKDYFKMTRKKDPVGRVYFNCNVLRDSSTNCDIFIPNHNMVINVDGLPHGLKSSKENDAKNIPKYLNAGYFMLLMRHESLDEIPNCMNVKVKSYASYEEKKKILKTFCIIFNTTDIFEYEYDEIIKLTKKNDYYLTEDEIKRCELLYQDVIDDYDGYRKAWRYEKQNAIRVA
ncbi:hypothetical protein [Enterocloster citroniae]